MSEYDYSGLYNNGGPQNNNGQPADTQPEQPQAEQSGYPQCGQQRNEHRQHRTDRLF